MTSSTPEVPTLRERQIQLEQESLLLGEHRYNESLDDQGTTTPGQRLLRLAVDPTALLIESFIERAADGKAGRKHRSLPYITKVDPEEAAYLTARMAINGAMAEHTVTRVALSIAGAIQEHLNILRLAREHPGLYRKVTEQLKKSTSARHRSAVYRSVVAKYSEKEVSWSQKEQLLLGMKLIELFIEATDMVRMVRMTRSAKDTPVELHMDPEWLERLTKDHKQCALLSPVHLPMVHPPRNWKHPYAGGYLTDALRPRLVRTRSREYLDELGSTQLDRVLDAVNTVQSVPWRINTRILEVIEELKADQQNVRGLPRWQPEALPPRPSSVPAGVKSKDLTLDQQEALKLWKTQAAKVHERNASTIAELGQLLKKLTVADRFRDEAAIYFPHYLDFRGRVYPFANYLNPQGDDVAKGLLEFSEGKPLGETGGFWLAVHIANLFGVDKVSFDDRVQWVLDNEEKLLDSAIDPVDGEAFWQTADSPFCALAACMEWASFKVNGDAHVSHLPIAMDGSCSGLQHFSALLRDEVGGAAVNLVPADKPADIYTTVANSAQVLSDTSVNEWSSVWSGKFCRKVAKQPTMTLCYSATKRGMHKQIENALGKLDEECGGRYLGEEVENYAAAKYASEIVWSALGDTVVAARAAMDWLQSAASLMSKARLPIRWTTPMGLPIMQAYRKTKGAAVEAFVGGQRVQLMLTTDTTDIDPRKQAASIAPNFVHSLDSAHLMRTAQLAKANGIRSLAVIHDSFGTHACDTDLLHAVIRESFIEQYTPDVLARFRDEVVAALDKVEPGLSEELPPLPAFGNLDLEQVRYSDFLFA